MNIFYRLSRIGKGREETSEKPKFPELQTRYYAADFSQVFQKVKELENEEVMGRMIKVDEARGEVLAETALEKDQFDVVLTVIPLESNVTVLDVVSSIRTKKGDGGKNFLIIDRILKIMDKSLPQNKV
ncbi:hypothetical protein [Alteribacillus bidgolensis]|uniref:Uncharacterized protein n=1 Tax=Alteribacillus bidgolensis TaxID=930129 RepID=A0A1G8CG70_9BACI|nr:hypothetical protein [Alteribacillus bidgolensis]SDH44466.1 hypothetical protein SAMN05216352_101311 [Alteribacillus bidgolensis]